MRMWVLAALALTGAAAGCSPQVQIQQRCEADGNAPADCACFTGALQAALSEPQMQAFARLQSVPAETDNEAEREAARRTLGLDGGVRVAAAAFQCGVTRGWFNEDAAREDRAPPP
ncbi:MAG: hypothetical protein AB7O04_11880 [Hyphomonadaceae bacterium]